MAAEYARVRSGSPETQAHMMAHLRQSGVDEDLLGYYDASEEFPDFNFFTVPQGQSQSHDADQEEVVEEVGAIGGFPTPAERSP